MESDSQLGQPRQVYQYRAHDDDLISRDAISRDEREGGATSDYDERRRPGRAPLSIFQACMGVGVKPVAATRG